MTATPARALPLGHPLTATIDRLVSAARKAGADRRDRGHWEAWPALTTSDMALCAARARLDAALGQLVADGERLTVAEHILGNFRNVPCLRELLGEDSDGCECMGCASRAYFRASPATPPTTTTETNGNE